PAGAAATVAAAPAPPPGAAAAGAPAAAPAARPAPVSPALTDLALGSVRAPAAGATVGTERTGVGGPRALARVLRLRRPASAPYAALGVTWRADPAVGQVRIVVRHKRGT